MHIHYYFFKSRPQEVFLGKGVLKKCSKFTGEHPRRNVISIKLQSDIIEITLWRGCSPVNLLCMFTTYFPRNTFGGPLLLLVKRVFTKNSRKSELGT